MLKYSFLEEFLFVQSQTAHLCLSLIRSAQHQRRSPTRGWQEKTLPFFNNMNTFVLGVYQWFSVFYAKFLHSKRAVFHVFQYPWAQASKPVLFSVPCIPLEVSLG